MSNSVRPHRQQPTRLPHPWDSLGKNTGVGCHFLLQCMKVKSLSHVRPFATPWTAAYQAPPSMGFSRQEYWSGVPLPSPKTLLVDRYSCTKAINETQIPDLRVLPIIELFPQYCMHLFLKIYFLAAVAIPLVFPVNLT